MKKIVLMAATAATLAFTACNSCGDNRQQAMVVETEIDSLYMVNDSTIGDKQTFIFEGLMPMDNGKIGNTLLAVETMDINQDGSYTISTTYVDDNANPATLNDSGETVVIIGIPNDSTAIIYELISDSGNPKMNLHVNKDSSLTRLDSNLKPVSKNPAHRLIHKNKK